MGRQRLQLARPTRGGGTREVPENGRIRLAGRPAVRAALGGDFLAEMAPLLAVPHGSKIEPIVAQVADFRVPDRARIDVPVGVDETG